MTSNQIPRKEVYSIFRNMHKYRVLVWDQRKMSRLMQEAEQGFFKDIVLYFS